jgi:hypothetical protein
MCRIVLGVRVVTLLVVAFPAIAGETGDVAWIRQFGGTSVGAVDVVQGVASDGTYVYAGGRSEGTLDSQPFLGIGDNILRKYDAATGALLWTREFGTPFFESIFAVAVDATGEYVTGRTDGALAPPALSQGFSDVFVWKFDAAGTVKWKQQIGSPLLDQGLGIASDGTSVFVAGRAGGAFPGQTSAGGNDAFIASYAAADGAPQWVRQFGTTAFEEAAAVAVHSTGVYVAGHVSQTIGVHRP